MLKVAYYIELFWLLIDSVSGYFLNKDIIIFGNQSIGSITRVFVFFYFLILLFKYLPIKYNVSFALFGVTIITVFIHYMENYSADIVTDYQFGIKLILPYLFYQVIKIQIERDCLDEHHVKKIIYFNSLVLVCNLFLSIFGIGFSMYQGGSEENLIGGKGFFFAGNEVNGTLLILYILTLAMLFRKPRRSMMTMVVVLFVFSLSSLLLYSKTAILGVLLISLLILIFSERKRRLLFIVVLFSLIMAATYSFWLPYLAGAIDRWNYFLEANANFFDFITSGRTERIGAFYSLYTEYLPGLPILFGSGWMGIHGLGSFENDALDLLISFGVLGITVYLMWGRWLIRNFEVYLTQKDQAAGYASFGIVLILSVSILAGHVMYSAMLAPFIALLSSLWLLDAHARQRTH